METVANFQSLKELASQFNIGNLIGPNHSADVQMDSIRTQLHILKNLETLENTIEYSTFGLV